MSIFQFIPLKNFFPYIPRIHRLLRSWSSVSELESASYRNVNFSQKHLLHPLFSQPNQY